MWFAGLPLLVRWEPFLDEHTGGALALGEPYAHVRATLLRHGRVLLVEQPEGEVGKGGPPAARTAVSRVASAGDLSMPFPTPVNLPRGGGYSIVLEPFLTVADAEVSPPPSSPPPATPVPPQENISSAGSNPGGGAFFGAPSAAQGKAAKEAERPAPALPVTSAEFFLAPALDTDLGLTPAADVQIRVDREFDRYPDGSAERGELIRDVVRDVARALNLTEPPGADRLLPISIAPGSVVITILILPAPSPAPLAAELVGRHARRFPKNAQRNASPVSADVKCKKQKTDPGAPFSPRFPSLDPTRRPSPRLGTRVLAPYPRAMELAAQAGRNTSALRTGLVTHALLTLTVAPESAEPVAATVAGLGNGGLPSGTLPARLVIETRVPPPPPSPPPFPPPSPSPPPPPPRPPPEWIAPVAGIGAVVFGLGVGLYVQRRWKVWRHVARVVGFEPPKTLGELRGGPRGGHGRKERRRADGGDGVWRDGRALVGWDGGGLREKHQGAGGKHPWAGRGEGDGRRDGAGRGRGRGGREGGGRARRQGWGPEGDHQTRRSTGWGGGKKSVVPTHLDPVMPF